MLFAYLAVAIGAQTTLRMSKDIRSMRKEHFWGGVGLSGLLLLPLHAQAADVSVDVLEQQLKGLEQTVLELKKQLDAVQARNEDRVETKAGLDAPVTRRDLNGFRADLE